MIYLMKCLTFIFIIIYTLQCNAHKCPSWSVSEWTECSKTCGEGHKYRTVQCKDHDGNVISDKCDHKARPNDKRKCKLIDCEDKNTEDGIMQRIPPESLSWIRHLNTPKSTVSSEPSFITGPWSKCNSKCGTGIRKRKVECKIMLEFSRTVAVIPDAQCPGIKPAEIEKCFVNCYNNDNDNDDHNDNDNEDEENYDHINNNNNNDKTESDHNYNDKHIHKHAKTLDSSAMALSFTSERYEKKQHIKYRWKTFGYTQCSASCLGGTQESVIQCIKDDESEIVNPYLCNIEDKPDSITRTCNDHPCPPRWNTSDYSPCSKTCGGGIQTREYNCIHELTRGVANTLIVKNEMCPQPPPRVRQFCNVFDCPAKWKLEPWTKCPKQPCGGGLKKRQIKCIKELAFGKIQEQSSINCPKRRPRTSKLCRQKPCKNIQKEPFKQAKDIKSNFITNGETIFVQKEPKDLVQIKVGGQAIIFEGSTVKIRCTLGNKNYTRKTIKWTKDGRHIKLMKRYHITRKGVFRIKSIGFMDAGRYTCEHKKHKAHLQIIVKPFTKHNNINRLNEIRKQDETIIDLSAKDNNKIKSTKTNQFNNNNNNEFDFNNRNDNFYLKQKHYDKSKQNSLPILVTKSPFTADNLQIVTHNPFKNSEIFVTPLTTDTTSTTITSTKTTTPYIRYATYRTTTTLPMETFTTTESPDVATSSAASIIQAPMPQLQNILSNLKNKFSFNNDYSMQNTDGNENNKDYNEFTKNDELIKNNNDPNNQILNEIVDFYVLGKGNIENINFEWIMSDWSPCSQICGGSGFQVRACQCSFKYNNISRRVRPNLCEDAGLKMPLTIRDCGFQECPQWHFDDWSTCTNCLSPNKGLQKRRIYCRLPNGHELNDNYCDQKLRPNNERECINENCRPIWTTGDWSECVGKCDEKGTKTRVLECVWSGTDKPAGKWCENIQRPSIIRPCIHLCSNNCVDQDELECSIVKKFYLCKNYGKQCCKSCSNRNNNNSFIKTYSTIRETSDNSDQLNEQQSREQHSQQQPQQQQQQQQLNKEINESKESMSG